MTSIEEIKSLAIQRVEEAVVLYENGKCDGAFYLAGYSVELMLKFKICERIGIPNLYDESNNNISNVKGLGEIRRFLKTHNLFVLLIMSGLKSKFDREKARDRNLTKANSLLFNNWSENIRYKPCGYMHASDVEDLLNLLKGENGFLSWIENN